LVLHRENRGYVLNALLGPVLTVALVLLVNGIADKEEIDAAWMKHRRAPMGPFGMMDLFGLNVVYDGWQHRESDPRVDELKPAVDALLESFLNKGELGVKTGKGFYSYPDPAFEQAGFVDTEKDISTPHYAMTTMLIGNAILLASGDIASPDEIDRAWTVGMTLDTGPFALLEEMGSAAFLQLLASDANTLLPSETKTVARYLEQSEETSYVGT
jgi:3-hydroxybutyryl-CoA dehydrogenase